MLVHLHLSACLFETCCRLELGWAFPSWRSVCQVCTHPPIPPHLSLHQCSMHILYRWWFIFSKYMACSPLVFFFFFLPVAFYTLLGFIQMSIWAKGKHRAYSREFKDYPSLRMAIIPLILWQWLKHAPLQHTTAVYLLPTGVSLSTEAAAAESSTMLFFSFFTNEWSERSGIGSNNIMAIYWRI